MEYDKKQINYISVKEEYIYFKCESLKLIMIVFGAYATTGLL